jgi:hypothetical protein
MARTISAPQNFNKGTVDQGARTQNITFKFYGSSNEALDLEIDIWWGWGYSASPSPSTGPNNKTQSPPGTLWWTNRSFNADCDDAIYTSTRGRTKSFFDIVTWDQTKNQSQGKTWAVNPTVGTPSLSAETSSTITVDGSWTPATKDTTVTLYVQYKKTSDSTWTQWGTSADTGTGYTSLSADQITITGLDSETSYDVRYHCDRTGTTNDTTSYYSSTATTSTIADTPSVTTDAASGIGITTATLNATVDHNTVDGNLSWRYIDTASYSAPPDDAQGTELSYSSNPITEDTTVGEQATGLTANTAYTFWAIYDPTGAGDTVFGAADTFTTQVDPGAQAAEQEMLPIITYDRKWGIATTVFFVVPQDAGSSSDLIYDGAAVWGAGETKMTGIVYDDDSTPTITAEANTTSNPARVASTPIYRLDLTAAEMQHDELYITLTNAGTSVRDIMLLVRTRKQLGTFDVDASAKATNTDAVTFTGNGTGAGLNCVAGDGDGVGIRGVLGDHVQNYGTLAAYNSSTSVDLDNSTAVTTNDYYNGAIILFHSGTGAGQARVITDYDGASYAATLNKAVATALDATTEYIIIPGPDTWAISPGAKLSALPSFTSNYADMIQFNFERFHNKRTQTATLFTLRDGDDSGDLATNAVDDDGTTQTHNQMA